MKHVLRQAVLLMLMVPILPAQEMPETGSLRVIVSGLRSNDGEIQIGLFNSAASYKGKSDRFRGSILPIADHRAEWLIEGIPFGEYAIKLFHDEDRDGKMDKNFIGIPSERFGFSNNPKISLGPPGFDKTKFLFDSKEMTIVIELYK
jgi:uncharacterized protein (DUF2141 family)